MRKHLKWIKGVAGTLVLGVITSFIYDGIKNYEFADTLKGWWKAIKSVVLQAANVEIKIWMIVLVVVVVVVVWFLTPFLMRFLKAKKPDYLPYTQEKIGGILWKWDWKRSQGQWQIVGLYACCPICETPLTVSTNLGIGQMVCPRDPRHVPYSGYAAAYHFDEENKVRTLIYDNVRKELY